MIRDRELSSVELLEHYLRRVDNHNDVLNAIVVDLRTDAMPAARAADEAMAAGLPTGPLHGLPMTVKESYNVAGAPTTWGNPDWIDNIAAEDAVAVQRLKTAGAIVFGKTNVPLHLADFQSYNEIYGTTNNPFDLERSPGGSSGGASTALAAGLTGLEIGSDIGGSIRNPAHYCGVFGHKPTWNLLWMRGHAPPGNSRSTPDISVIGPLGRSAADLETAMHVLAGPDDIAARGYRLDLPTPGQAGMKGMKIAVWSDDDTCPVSSETRERVAAVAKACRDAGAQVDESARPDFSAAACYETFQFLLQAQMAARMPQAEYDSLAEYLTKLDPDDESRTAKVLRARASTSRQWRQHDEMRQQLRWKWHAFFERFDVLITPIMPTAAFVHDHGKMGSRTIMVDDEELSYLDQSFWAGLTGVSYLPSTVIPTGLNEYGLPIGVQIVGPEYGDLITIDVARQLEAAGFRFIAPPDYA